MKKSKNASSEIDQIEGIIRIPEGGQEGPAKVKVEGPRTKAGSAEIEAIHEREMRDQGFVRVDEPSEVVQVFSDALRGEVALTGEDAGWKRIGGLPIGGTATIKAEDGQPLFRLTLTAIPGTSLADDPNTNYAVMIKRSEDGGVQKLLINFTEGSEMAYSNLSQQTKQEEIARMIQGVKLGLMKPK